MVKRKVLLALFQRRRLVERLCAFMGAALYPFCTREYASSPAAIKEEPGDARF
jgi:hypothetical protein